MSGTSWAPSFGTRGRAAGSRRLHPPQLVPREALRASGHAPPPMGYGAIPLALHSQAQAGVGYVWSRCPRRTGVSWKFSSFLQLCAGENFKLKPPHHGVLFRCVAVEREFVSQRAVPEVLCTMLMIYHHHRRAVGLNGRPRRSWRHFFCPHVTRSITEKLTPRPSRPWPHKTHNAACRTIPVLLTRILHRFVSPAAY